jgi:hypothetical protein
MALSIIRASARHVGETAAKLLFNQANKVACRVCLR